MPALCHESSELRAIKCSQRELPLSGLSGLTGIFKLTNLFDNLFLEVKPSYYETDGQGNEVPWYPPHPDQIRYEPSTFPPLLLKIRK